ncbi:hypothetical protein [Nitrospirillum pindoramense]|uniref:Uncharacterized protein n=1 Tax=Nitrospirillum amazonense TaxID=28077 RepID=A0A560H6N4_9PROT|nr:hypothetical protein [Nitrospirillum amazonense]TWB41938.1 hypothetical protein FBZ90_107317 [Nitrospirillum amazonense]
MEFFGARLVALAKADAMLWAYGGNPPCPLPEIKVVPLHVAAEALKEDPKPYDPALDWVRG